MVSKRIIQSTGKIIEFIEKNILNIYRKNICKYSQIGKALDCKSRDCRFESDYLLQRKNMINKLEEAKVKGRRDVLKKLYTIPTIIILGDLVKPGVAGGSDVNPACNQKHPPPFCSDGFWR